MKVFKKTLTRYRLNGKNVTRDTPGATKRNEKSKRFYGSLRLATGAYKQVPLTFDRDTSRTLLRRLQHEEDISKASGLPRTVRDRQKPICEYVEAYRESLTAKNNTPLHIAKTISRITRIIEATGAKQIDDLDSDRIQSTLKGWRDNGAPKDSRGRKSRSFGVESSNNHIRAMRGFSRWIWHAEITPDDTLRGLRVLNSRPDRRHVRRALSESELSRLIETTRESETIVQGMCPQDRAMLYTLASYTGLRASELASLATDSIDLDQCVIRVEAAYSKHRRDDTLPLHPSLVTTLRPWLASKPPGDHLFPGRWAVDRRAGKILQGDLDRAGIPYRDSQGKVADFHALRHTYITSLARAKVHPATAQRLARHSSIELTMGVYTHLEADTLREALASVPGPQ